MSSDDWTYRFIFTKKTLVQSFGDVLYSQQIHWFKWGGRFVAHCMVQTVLMWDKMWFNIANTIAYALCSFFIVKLIFQTNLLRNYLLVLLSFWVIMPSPGGTMFWLTGSFNYLWPSMFAVGYLCLLLSEKRWCVITSIPLALIAGNGHESISVGVATMLVLYAFLTTRKPMIFYVSITCFIIGMLTNVLAPGNFVRFESVTSVSSSGGLALIMKYFKYFMKLGYRLTLNWTDLGVQCCTALWTIAAIYCIRKRDAWKVRDMSYILILCFTVGSVATLGLNVLSGTAYVRSVYGFCFFAYLTFLFVVSRISKEKLNLSLLMVAILANVVFVPVAWRDISIFNENIERAVQCIKKGTSIAVAHEDSQMLHESRFGSYAPSPCLLKNSIFSDFQGGKDFSLVEADTARIILHRYPDFQHADYHKVINLDGGVSVVRLKDRPDKVQENISVKPLTDSHAGYLAKIQHWILSQMKPEQQSSVINIDNAYYLFWISRGFQGNATVVYDSERVDIPIE